MNVQAAFEWMFWARERVGRMNAGDVFGMIYKLKVQAALSVH